MTWPEQFETEAISVAALQVGLEKGEGRMLQRNETVALGGARGYVFRQVWAIIMLALQARRQAKTHTGGEASCASDGISLCPRKASVQSSSRAGRRSAAAPHSCELRPALRAVAPSLASLTLPIATRRDQRPSLPPQDRPPGEAAGFSLHSGTCLDIQINRITSAEQALGHHPRGKSPVQRKCTERPFGRVGNSVLVSRILSQHCYC